jgi:hypothetical protein
VDFVIGVVLIISWGVLKRVWIFLLDLHILWDSIQSDFLERVALNIPNVCKFRWDVSKKCRRFKVDDSIVNGFVTICEALKTFQTRKVVFVVTYTSFSSSVTQRIRSPTRYLTGHTSLVVAESVKRNMETFRGLL